MMVSIWQSFKQTWLASNDDRPIFDYKALRRYVGLAAVSLPMLVIYFSGTSELTSISVGYYSQYSRDIYVGFLFAIGAFLLAYNGHFFYESIASKLAASGAFIGAVAPTDCRAPQLSDFCQYDHLIVDYPTIHLVAAGVMFLVLIYFCLGCFRKRAWMKYKADPSNVWARNRAWLYSVCGAIMILALLAGEVIPLVIGHKPFGLVLVTEMLALFAFGIAWLVAGVRTKTD
jgi:hypothetical protein